MYKRQHSLLRQRLNIEVETLLMRPGIYIRRAFCILLPLIYAVEGLERGGECVVAICCLLICKLSVRNFHVVASFVHSFLSLTAPSLIRWISMPSLYSLIFNIENVYKDVSLSLIHI